MKIRVCVLFRELQSLDADNEVKKRIKSDPPVMVYIHGLDARGNGRNSRLFIDSEKAGLLQGRIDGLKEEEFRLKGITTFLIPLDSGKASMKVLELNNVPAAAIRS